MNCQGAQPNHTFRRSETDKQNEALDELVEKAVHGDSHALYSLCETLASSINFRARYMMGNDMDAEDVAQNVLLRVCENIRSLRDPRAFRAWLGSIVVNEARRFFATHSKYSNVTNIEDLTNEIADEKAERFTHECEEDDRSERGIMGLILRLPRRQREAVLLHYYDGLSVSKVAEAMDISHQCVSRYLTLAQNKLRSEFEKHRHAPSFN